MNNNTIGNLLIIGVPCLIGGIIIGSKSVYQNDNANDFGVRMWKTMAEFFKDEYLRAMNDNQKLKNELYSKEKAN